MNQALMKNQLGLSKRQQINKLHKLCYNLLQVSAAAPKWQINKKWWRTKYIHVKKQFSPAANAVSKQHYKETDKENIEKQELW